MPRPGGRGRALCLLYFAPVGLAVDGAGGAGIGMFGLPISRATFQSVGFFLKDHEIFAMFDDRRGFTRHFGVRVKVNWPRSKAQSPMILVSSGFIGERRR